MSILVLRSSIVGGGGGGGDLVHGQSFNVTGSGFGVKATPAPALLDKGTAATGTLDAVWTDGWPNSTTYQTKNRDDGFNSIAVPHPYVTRFIGGAHGGTGAGASPGGQQVHAFITRTRPSFPYYSYWSYYWRCDPNWQFSGDNNFKWWLHSGGTAPFDAPNWYLEFNEAQSSTTSDGTYHFLVDAGNSLAQFSDNNGHSAYWDDFGPAINQFNAANGWVKLEIEILWNSTNAGYVKVWENGKLKMNYQGRTDGDPGTTRCEAIGGYARANGFSTNYRYFADVYNDFSVDACARVVLANNATLANATILEPQPPAVWTDTSIDCTCWKGKLSSGTVHVHVKGTGNTWQYIGTRTIS